LIDTIRILIKFIVRDDQFLQILFPHIFFNLFLLFLFLYFFIVATLLIFYKLTTDAFSFIHSTICRDSSIHAFKYPIRDRSEVDCIYMF